MKTFKTILVVTIAVAMAVSANAATSVTTAKIYLNPGHGSWGPNDRPMATIPYPMLSSTGRPDTCGFYESNTNLWKAMRMKEALVDLGMKAANVKLSRTKNGPYPYVAGASNATQYNRNLSEICEEVDTWAPDMFFSVHSDAATEGSTANRSLYLFRGKDNNNYVAGSKAMAQALWTRAYVGVNEIDYASSTSTNIRGDIDFYGSSSTRYGTKGNYTGYLGVLKHGIPGFLAEGYCHTYQPARHRALNSDYCGQEGVRYARGVADYFGWTKDSKGYIMGFVKDKSKSVNNSLYTYKSGTRAGDEYWPVMGAYVYLYKDGVKVGRYKTDNNYNGVFVFDRLDPGTYTIIVKASGYADYTTTTTVTANTTTYPKIYLTQGQGTDPDEDPDTPDTPTGEKIKGVFAYGLNLTKGDNSFTFTFNANSDALSGKIVFTDSITGNNVGMIPLTGVHEGANSFTFTNDQLPEAAGADQVLNWSVELTGKPITQILKLNDGGNTFSYTRASVTVDNSPESDYFGYVYVNDLKTRNASGSNASNRDNGIYRYNPLWVRENSSPYTGNMAWDNNFRITTDYKGRLYVPDFGDNHSGVYIAEPDNLSGTWPNFFAGSRLLSGETAGLIDNNGVYTGSSSPAVNVVGSGVDTKLYASLEDFEYNVYCYDLGANMTNGQLPSKWYTTPELVHQKTKLKYTNTNVIARENGAVWVSENLYTTAGSQSNLAAQPALRYITPAHDDYWSYATNSNTPVTNLNGCAGGGFAISNDGQWLVIVDGDGILQFFDIGGTLDKPLLSWTRSYNADAKDSGCTSVGGGRVPNGVYQMSFDWGGNLYVAGGSLGIYSIPQSDNTHLTPAKRSLTLTRGEVVIPEPEPYVIKKDIDTYAATDEASFESNWVRSVKEEYANIVFDEDGIKNRGFTVSGDKVLITARSENTTNADLSLLVLDRATGESIGTIPLSNEAQVELYGNNDIMLDAAGNIVISSLTTDVSTVPLQLFVVDTISGNVTHVASLLKTNAGAARVDHCTVFGDVTSGNFKVMAPQASGKQLMTWTVENGQVVSSHVVEAQAFYPANATHFGIAPRIYAVDASHAVVTGSTVHPSVYDMTTGALDDSFASNTAIQPAGLYANGFASFALGTKKYMVYPNQDYRSATGNQWTLAVADAGATTMAEYTKMYEFPTRGLGAVHSQTWGAPVQAVVADDGKSAEIVVYVPGEGVASYTLTDLSPDAPEPYIVKKDIDTYADTLDLHLESNWVRSVKEEYANIEYEENGLRNRGCAVLADKVYLTGRSSNSIDADIYLDVLDRATGETIGRLDVSDNAKVGYYPMNDVMTDAGGHLLVSNLSLNLSTTPLQLFQIDTISGNATLVASLGCDEALRIDHCAIYGDVADGVFTVMAAQANGGKLVSWVVGDSTVCTVVEAQAYYPAGAGQFGIAPRITAVDATHAWVSGSMTHPSLYDITTGEMVDGFASNSGLQPNGINANGFAAFTLKGQNIVIYPTDDHNGSNGNRWAMAINGNAATIDGMQRAFVFPQHGLGAVYSQTWGAPALAAVNPDGVSADVFIFAPGEGVASYTVTYIGKPEITGDVNNDGQVNTGDISELYIIILGIDLTNIDRADINGDNEVNTGDVSALYRIILGF